MTTVIDPARRFQLWEYHVSHGTALLRSPRGSRETANIDIMLFGVEYLALPRHLEALRLERGTDDEERRVAELLGREPGSGRVWVLISAGVRHLVVAAKVDVRETSMDIFDSPFEGT